MKLSDWESVFRVSTEILGVGNPYPKKSDTWCSWTTFGRLEEDSGYWTSGLPNNNDIGRTFIRDNGVWLQPFLYEDIAHLIIPKKFSWETIDKEGYESGTKTQDIEKLSYEFNKLGIKHNLSKYCLDFKIF